MTTPKTKIKFSKLLNDPKCVCKSTSDATSEGFVSAPPLSKVFDITSKKIGEDISSTRSIEYTTDKPNITCTCKTAAKFIYNLSQIDKINGLGASTYLCGLLLIIIGQIIKIFKKKDPLTTTIIIIGTIIVAIPTFFSKTLASKLIGEDDEFENITMYGSIFLIMVIGVLAIYNNYKSNDKELKKEYGNDKWYNKLFNFTDQVVTSNYKLLIGSAIASIVIFGLLSSDIKIPFIVVAILAAINLLIIVFVILNIVPGIITLFENSKWGFKSSTWNWFGFIVGLIILIADIMYHKKNMADQTGGFRKYLTHPDVIIILISFVINFLSFFLKESKPAILNKLYSSIIIAIIIWMVIKKTGKKLENTSPIIKQYQETLVKYTGIYSDFITKFHKILNKTSITLDDPSCDQNCSIYWVAFYFFLSLMTNKNIITNTNPTLFRIIISIFVIIGRICIGTFTFNSESQNIAMRNKKSSIKETSV